MSCVECGSTKNLQVHHDSYNPIIVRTLCKKCHQKFHNHATGGVKYIEPKNEFISRVLTLGSNNGSIICIIPNNIVKKYKIKPKTYLKLKFIEIIENNTIELLNDNINSRKIIFDILNEKNIPKTYHEQIFIKLLEINSKIPKRKKVFVNINSLLASIIYKITNIYTQEELSILFNITEVTIRKWNKKIRMGDSFWLAPTAVTKEKPPTMPTRTLTNAKTAERR